MVRSRLHDRLDHATRCPVTVVAAPAGWGKTVLLSAWLRARPAGGPPAAWLATGPGPFWPALHAAVRLALAGHPDLPPAPAGEDPSYPDRLAAALPELPEPLIVVVDDLHATEGPRVGDGLARLVGTAAGRLRLVVAGRGEPDLPVSRWRLTGEVAEIGAAELAFTPAEAAELLAGHGVQLPEPYLTDLCRRTEGWPAGLRMFAWHARGRPDPAAVARRFGGGTPVVAGYLADEVLAGLPAPVVDTLTRTCLTDDLSGELVAALTGRDDGERMLAGLAAAHAFVTRRDATTPRYRVHPMLAESLRERLHRDLPGQVPVLHRRAADWYAATDRPVRALLHAVAGGDWPAARALVGSAWPRLVLDGPVGVPAPAGATPPAPQDLRDDPELALALAAERLARRDSGTADLYLHAATGGDRWHWRRPGVVTAATGLRLAAARLSGDLPALRARAGELLAAARRDGTAREATVAVAAVTLGIARLHSGDLAGAALAGRAGGAYATRAGLRAARALAAGQLALVHALAGRLCAAADAAQVARRMAAGTDPAWYHGYAHLADAVVHLARNRLDRAHRDLDLAAALAARDPALAAAVLAVRAELCHGQGDLPGACRAVTEARRALATGRVSPLFSHRLGLTEAAVRTGQGDTRTARQVLAPLCDDRATDPVSARVALARTYLADGDPARAARELPDGNDPALPPAVRVEARLLEAVVARRLGDPRRAAAALESAVRVALPEGLRRPFAGGGPAVQELLAGHLAAHPAERPWLADLLPGAVSRDHTPHPAVTGPLTAREHAVLRYLPSVMSAAEIASELYLSVNTVKTHLRHIYRKLGTAGRRETVRRARELRLL
ncbi:MAG: LuxR C-terminal-related transcriptional regulator [Micromonosporaceae bacterium]